MILLKFLRPLDIALIQNYKLRVHICINHPLLRHEFTAAECSWHLAACIVLSFSTAVDSSVTNKVGAKDGEVIYPMDLLVL